jgi:hypothetical protein
MEKLVGARRPSAFSTTDDINRMLPWIWVSALVGGAVLLASGSRRRQGRSALLIPVAIAVSQFAAVVLILPYSERLVLPFYTPLLPYAAVPIGALANLIGIGTPRGQVIR